MLIFCNFKFKISQDFKITISTLFSTFTNSILSEKPNNFLIPIAILSAIVVSIGVNLTAFTTLINPEQTQTQNSTLDDLEQKIEGKLIEITTNK